MLKKLREKRHSLLEQLDALLLACEDGDEVRSFTEEEQADFEKLEQEIRAIDSQLIAIEQREALELQAQGGGAGDSDTDETRAREESDFLNYINGETRSLSVGDNGGIIPNHIANRIIETVREISPIYALATVFNVGGNLIFPVDDESSGSVSADFIDDMAELTEGTGKFITVKLESHIVGSLGKVSRSLMNRTDFDLLSFVIRKIAKKISEFLELKLITGSPGKNEGVMSSKNVITTDSTVAITSDNLIDLQLEVLLSAQANSCFLMHKNTLKAVRKLKDTDGAYLLQRDLTQPFGFSLLGRPIFVTESMDQIGAGKTVVAYGDMSGLYVKLSQNLEIQVLLEKYATQHAIGVVGFVEFDSKIVEPQLIAVLRMKAGS